jgi:NitT/TauT family transport system substrate-binding protein
MCHLCETTKEMSETEYSFNPTKGRREFILDMLAACNGQVFSERI